MASILLWAAGFALASLILFRLLKCGLVRHYPFFFAYMAIVWISTAILWPIYLYRPGSYKIAFWVLQFLSVLTGFGVLLEVLQKSLERYAGARRYATSILVGMFAIILGFFVYPLLVASSEFSARHFASSERDFRTVQAITVAGLLGVIYYYRIDVGKNLRGIVGGFGLYVGCTILSHAMRGYWGSSFDAAWRVIQPYTYLVSLVIWTTTLWSYAPVPPPEVPPDFDEDNYSGLARTTREEMVGLRTNVGRVERP
ncbi:MAG: hypothetical protein ACRD59_09305 [Candidatus Acidiferrales bacterium]